MKINQTYKNLGIWLVIGIIMILLFNLFGHPPKKEGISYSDFLDKVESDQVVGVIIKGSRVRGNLVSGETFQTYIPKRCTIGPAASSKTCKDKGRA